MWLSALPAICIGVPTGAANWLACLPIVPNPAFMRGLSDHKYEIETIPAYKIEIIPAAAGLALIAAGLFFFLGSFFRWRWLITEKPASLVSGFVSDGAVRSFYLVLGAFLVVIGWITAAGFGIIEAVEWFLWHQLSSW